MSPHWAAQAESATSASGKKWDAVLSAARGDKRKRPSGSFAGRQLRAGKASADFIHESVVQRLRDGDLSHAHGCIVFRELSNAMHSHSAISEAHEVWTCGQGV